MRWLRGMPEKLKIELDLNITVRFPDRLLIEHVSGMTIKDEDQIKKKIDELLKNATEKKSV